MKMKRLPEHDRGYRQHQLVLSRSGQSFLQWLGVGSTDCTASAPLRTFKRHGVTTKVDCSSTSPAQLARSVRSQTLNLVDAGSSPGCAYFFFVHGKDRNKRDSNSGLRGLESYTTAHT